jgi:hypothetical protein
MEDNNARSSQKKHAASDESDAHDANPSRLKRARRTREGEEEEGTSVSAAAAASATPTNGSVRTMNHLRVLLCAEKSSMTVPPPPPPPPRSKPPKQTAAMKCIFLGPCEKERTAFIQRFVNRGRNDETVQKKVAAIKKTPSVWSMDYSKKEYSYQNPQGVASTILLQFYNIGCKINSSEKQHQPPAAWKSLCSSFDHVVLVLSITTTDDDSSIQNLTRTIDAWKAWMHSHCAPVNRASPMSLLLTTTSTTTATTAVGDKCNGNNGVNVGPTSTSSATQPPPGLLIRLGAALEVCRQKHGFLDWYLWDAAALNHSNSNNNVVDDDDDDDIGKMGMHSMDEIIQSLVESTRETAAAAMATSPPSLAAMMPNKDNTAARTDNTSNSTGTAKKNPGNSSSGESPPGPDDIPLTCQANGESP